MVEHLQSTFIISQPPSIKSHKTTIKDIDMGITIHPLSLSSEAMKADEAKPGGHHHLQLLIIYPLVICGYSTGPIYFVELPMKHGDFP